MTSETMPLLNPTGRFRLDFLIRPHLPALTEKAVLTDRLTGVQPRQAISQNWGLSRE